MAALGAANSREAPRFAGTLSLNLNHVIDNGINHLKPQEIHLMEWRECV